MSDSPLIFLVDDGTLAPLATALHQAGRTVAVQPGFDQVVASLSPTTGAIVYFDPQRTPRPERFEISVRSVGTAVLLVAVLDAATMGGGEPVAWHDWLAWPLAPAELERSVARHLEQARRRRLLFEVGSRFARGLHDIRTPLGGIKGYASTLNTYWEKLAEHDRREAIGIIETEVDRVTELLEDLSRVERELRRGEWQG